MLLIKKQIVYLPIFLRPKKPDSIVDRHPMGKPETGSINLKKQTNLQLYKSSSPIYQVDAQSSATLILHGTVDTIVRVQQSTKLDSVLTNKGVVHSYFPYIGENHGWFGVTLTKSLNQMNTFLTANVQ